ncbi:MAG: hypothetical protein KTR26_16100 [Flammeovirgaceae bacterium]|nr:hypothetical protein [Flammeovirgaceae bacterium]
MDFLKKISIILILFSFIGCAKQKSQTSQNQGNATNSRGYNPQKKQFKSSTKNAFSNKKRTSASAPKSARQLRKEEKMKQKPQYTDPMYFGHKKPPKKRPRGKQKYCKVCQMRH